MQDSGVKLISALQLNKSHIILQCDVLPLSPMQLMAECSKNKQYNMMR